MFGPDGKSVYAGTVLLTMARGVTTDSLGEPQVSFRRPNNDPEVKTLEEEMRAVLHGGDFRVIRG